MEKEHLLEVNEYLWDVDATIVHELEQGNERAWNSCFINGPDSPDATEFVSIWNRTNLDRSSFYRYQIGSCLIDETQLFINSYVDYVHIVTLWIKFVLKRDSARVKKKISLGRRSTLITITNW